MPIPAIALGAAVAGGTQLINAGINSANNAATRNHNMMMYGRQRADNLMDWNMQNAYNLQMWDKQNAYDAEVWAKNKQWDIDRWNMQNEYDSPAAQMRRFKEAGINPYAMFGNLQSGQGMDASQLVSQSRPEAPNMKGANAMPWHPQAPQFSLNGIMSILDAKLKKVEIDNAQKIGRNLDTENAAKVLGLTSTEIANKRAGLEYSQSSRLADYEYDLKEQLLYNTKLDMGLRLQANERAEQELGINYGRFGIEKQRLGIDKTDLGIRKAKLGMDYAMFNDNLAKLQVEVSNAIKDGQLKMSVMEEKKLEQAIKRWEIELNTHGLNTNDNFFIRAGIRDIDWLGQETKKRLEEIWNSIGK